MSLISKSFNRAYSIILKNQRAFGTSRICIVAGNRTQDFFGAKIMRELKALDNNIEFLGIGGDMMKAEGLTKSYANVDKFLDKPFLPIHNFKHKNAETIIYPPLIYFNWHNYQVWKELRKNHFMEHVFEARPDAFLTLGNEYFMMQMYLGINKLYNLYDEVKPPMMLYDKVIISQAFKYQEYLDHIFYTIPLQPVNWQNFTFPSTYVGSFAIYEALEWLYKTSDKHKSLIKENTLLVSKEYFTQINEELINQRRIKYREANNIDESTNIFYASPGNTPRELKWAIPLIYSSIMEFMKKFAKPLSKSPRALESENFALVLSCPTEHEALFKSLVSKHQWPCKLIITNTADEKYSALAASDMAVCVNGQAVGECALFQVPTAIIDPLNHIQTYLTYLYNSFGNDLNIAAGGEIYPELINGRANPGKIADVWEEFFLNPKKKYKFMERFNKLLPMLLPQVQNQIKGFGKPTSLTVDNMNFEEHFSSTYLMTKKIIQAKDAYAEVKKAQTPRYQIQDARATVLKTINPVY